MIEFSDVQAAVFSWHGAAVHTVRGGGGGHGAAIHKWNEMLSRKKMKTLGNTLVCTVVISFNSTVLNSFVYFSGKYIAIEIGHLKWLTLAVCTRVTDNYI